MSSDSITLIVAGDPLTPIEGKAGLLIECASDAGWVPAGAASLHELLGPPEESKRIAADLVHGLLDGEPSFEGVRHLYTFKESLIRAAAEAVRAVRLYGWLQEQGISRCIFRSHSLFAQLLRGIARHRGTTLEVLEPPEAIFPLPKRIADYLRATGKRGLGAIPRLALHRITPLLSRVLLYRREQPKNEHRWWFYSTFYTFTGIGLAYERALTSKFTYLIGDPGSAERPLEYAGRPWTEIYAYVRPRQIPSVRELQQIRDQLKAHLLRVPLSKDEDLIRQLLMSSVELNEILYRKLGIGILHVRAFDRWCNRERPELLVVGNEVWEGYLLQKARANGIPTLLLQHGVLGDFYQVTEHSADLLLVRGRFWLEFISPASQRRSVILNCASPAVSKKMEKGRDLLFVTADYFVQKLFHLEDLTDILRECVRAASQAKRSLVIRVHPRESSALYQEIIRKIAKEGLQADVRYSTGHGLEETISASAVAVLYSSTVFLDCLRLGVPVVSFDWHHFAYKDQLRRHGVFAFARNLQHLQSLLLKGLNYELAPSVNYGDFVASASDEEVAAFFEAFARNPHKMQEQAESQCQPNSQ